MISAVIPFSGAGDLLQVVFGRSVADLVVLAALLNSFALDYVARQKVGSMNLSQFILEQLPIPTPSDLATPAPWEPTSTVYAWLLKRAGLLGCTADDTLVLWSQLAPGEAAPAPWSESLRRNLRAELDAAVFHIYGYTRGEVEHAMSSFSILRRADEQHLGEYRTA